MSFLDQLNKKIPSSPFSDAVSKLAGGVDSVVSGIGNFAGNVVGGAKAVGSALAQPYTNPSQATKQVEQGFGFGANKPINLPPGLQQGADFVGKAVIRTFAPMLEPLGKDIGQVIAVNEIAPKVAKGELPISALNQLEVLKKYNPQIVGDVAQAVLAAYSPSFFSGTAMKVAGSPVASAMATGGIQGALGGALFGGASTLSSGDYSAKNIATRVGTSALAGGVLGAIISGAIPASKAVVEKVKKVQEGLKQDFINAGYDPAHAEQMANQGGYARMSNDSFFDEEGFKNSMVNFVENPETGKLEGLTAAGDLTTDFKTKYVATDGWRGYYEAVPKKGTGWEKVDSDWVTGDYADSGANAASVVDSKLKQLYSKVKAQGGEMTVVTAPTSNVFSTGYDVFVKGVDKSTLGIPGLSPLVSNNQAAIAEIQKANPQFFSKENLKFFGDTGKYKIATDDAGNIYMTATNKNAPGGSQKVTYQVDPTTYQIGSTVDVPMTDIANVQAQFPNITPIRKDAIQIRTDQGVETIWKSQLDDYISHETGSMSGMRSLGGIKGDWRMIDSIAQDAQVAFDILDNPGASKPAISLSTKKSPIPVETKGNPPGVMEQNNLTALEIDKHNRSWNGTEYTYPPKVTLAESGINGNGTVDKLGQNGFKNTDQVANAVKPNGLVDKIIAYEDGSLSQADTIAMFQQMVDDGSVWSLQGSYGRTANELLQQGLIKPPKNPAGTDAYGNPLKDYFDNLQKNGLGQPVKAAIDIAQTSNPVPQSTGMSKAYKINEYVNLYRQVNGSNEGLSSAALNKMTSAQLTKGIESFLRQLNANK